MEHIQLQDQWFQQFKHYLDERYAKSSVMAYCKDITHFFTYLGERSCLALNEEDIQAYLDYNSTLLKSDGSRLFKNTSLKRQRASLVSFYNFLIEQQVTDTNPASNVRFELNKKRVELDYLTKEEAVTFLNYIKYFNSNESNFLRTRDAFMVRLALNTGIRIHEIKRLEFDWFNFETNELSICDKNNQIRIVPFTPDLKEDYDAYLVHRQQIKAKSETNQNRVFLTSRGGLLSTQMTNTMLDRHAKQSFFHKTMNNSILRHTFAHNLIQATELPEERKAREKVLKQLAYLLGHESHYFTLQVYECFFEKKEQITLTDRIAI